MKFRGRKALRSQRGFDIGIWGIIFGVAALAIAFGGKRFAGWARKLGRAKGEFQLGELEVQKEVEAAKRAVVEPAGQNH